MSGYIGSTPVPQATQHRESFTATEGQTSFATVGYTPQFVDVYLNGSHLSPADFTATNGSDVVLAVAASADDVCDIISYAAFTVADQTFTGTTTMDVAAITGILTTTAKAVSNGGIGMPDDAKLTFGGTGTGDLQIFHDGSHSRINEEGTGVLFIQTNGTSIQLNKGTSENMLVATVDGAVDLYHNNVKKIETTATGVAVVAGGVYTTAAGNDLNLVVPDGRSIFFKEASQTHATINNAGNLLVGATSVFGASRATIQCASGDQALSLKTAKTTGSEAILLFADGDNDTCGNITINTGSQQAALANGSDYRLKTDVQPMTGAATRVQALNPVNFEWLSDGSRIDGFLAHEAQAVVPDAVFGTHNATKTLTNVVISSSNRVLSENIEQSDWTTGKSATTDEDGNAVAAIYPSNSTWAAEHVVPEMQMMDHTKMIPLLVASLQEALARIETLESKVAVLEG